MNQQHESISIPPDLERYIFENEILIDITPIPERIPTKRPSGVHELYRLAHVTLGNQVGAFGPVLAALAIEVPPDVDTPPVLQRYEALFGRDSLRVALDLLPLYPHLTRSTILTLAHLQGLQWSATKEEEPGRIIHESRGVDDPVRHELTEAFGWGWPYYGSIDSTPEYIRTIAAYCNDSSEGDAFLFQKYHDSNGTTRIIADSLTFAVDWLTRRLDSNPEGLLESLPWNKNSIENQVWKDSWDSYSHNDGTLASHHGGVASVEVQRLAYDALIDGASVYEQSLGRKAQAADLRARAARLKTAIFSLFWTEEKGGYFVLGLDHDSNGELRQLKLRTSNMGHLLNSRLLDGEDPSTIRYRDAIVRHLFSPEMLTQQGIRTLASDEVRYRPGAYHNGSVWLWDTHFIGNGLRRHGYDELADSLTEKLLHIIDVTKKFPEFVRGEDTAEPQLTTRTVDVWDSVNNRINRIEQPPQEIQAWTVSAVIVMEFERIARANQTKKRVISIAEAQMLQPSD